MLRKVESRELLTKSEARKKYRSSYIFMEIIDIVDGQDNDLSYVLYTVDEEKDKSLVPLELFAGDRIIASMPGNVYEPFGQIGKIVYHGEN